VEYGKLVSAAAKGDLAELQAALAVHPEWMDYDVNGDNLTLLMIAAMKGNKVGCSKALPVGSRPTAGFVSRGAPALCTAGRGRGGATRHKELE
jgi:hypothetical protein